MNVQLVSSFHEKLNLKQKPELNPEIDVLRDISMVEFGNINTSTGQNCSLIILTLSIMCIEFLLNIVKLRFIEKYYVKSLILRQKL